MGRTFLICAVLSGMFFSACNYIPAKKKLLVYSEISGTNDSLTRMTREWYSLLTASLRDKNFSKMSGQRLKMGEFLSKNRSAIANLQAGPNGQSILDSEEVFLAAEATVINDVYSSFESYNEMTPIETINAQLRLLINDQRNEMNWTGAIKRSLDMYLRKNKLKAGK